PTAFIVGSWAFWRFFTAENAANAEKNILSSATRSGCRRGGFVRFGNRQDAKTPGSRSSHKIHSVPATLSPTAHSSQSVVALSWAHGVLSIHLSGSEAAQAIDMLALHVALPISPRIHRRQLGFLEIFHRRERSERREKHSVLSDEKRVPPGRLRQIWE